VQAQALKNMGHDVLSMTEFLQTRNTDGFVHSLSKFPVSKALPSAYPSFSSMKETPPPHIPDYFPAFPDEHALKETAEFYAAENSVHAKQAQVASQQQQAEEALLYLQARETTADDILQTAVQYLQDRKEDDEGGVVDETTEQPNKFLTTPIWEAIPDDKSNDSMPPIPKANASSKDETSKEKIRYEWESLQNSKPVNMKFSDWQWTKSLEGRASLSSVRSVNCCIVPLNVLSSRHHRWHAFHFLCSLQGDDAFTQEAMDGSGITKRRTLLSGSEMLKARVQELVTSREEEAETYMMVDEQLPQEHI
jgi:hypothetical protein